MKVSSLIVVTALLALAWAPAAGRAQSAEKRTTPAPDPLQALTQALAGKWQLDVRFGCSIHRQQGRHGSGEESWSAGPGGITLIEQEHIRSPNGDALLMGVIWWDSTRNHLGGVERNSYLPVTCDQKGALNDITISGDGRKFQIDEQETHNGRHTVWHEYTYETSSRSAYRLPKHASDLWMPRATPAPHPIHTRPISSVRLSTGFIVFSCILRSKA